MIIHNSTPDYPARHNFINLPCYMYSKYMDELLTVKIMNIIIICICICICKSYLSAQSVLIKLNYNNINKT